MKDYCLRVTSKNGEVRGFFSTSRNMVEAARGFHNTTKVATAALGRTLTATSMMGLMMKNPNDKVTIIKGWRTHRYYTYDFRCQWYGQGLCYKSWSRG